MITRGTPHVAALALAAVCAAWLDPAVTRAAQVRLDPLTDASAGVGEEVVLHGEGFGAVPGSVILTGRRITPRLWSDQSVVFSIPDDGASGFVRVRPVDGAASDKIPFTVNRRLPAGQVAPYGLRIDDTGLPGAAFLVETDGAYLYGVSGFETLCTYALLGTRPHAFRSRFYLNQRVAALRLAGGFLFCAGDHGLLVYRCSDLRAGTATVVAAIAGGSYLDVDVRPDPTGEWDGQLVGLCEHMPCWGSTTLRVVFYQFAGEELTRLGTFSRSVGADERQFAVVLDPLNRKAYVSGWDSMTGANKYILELATTNLAAPTLNYREQTGGVLACDMDATGTILWAGVAASGTELFRAYTLEGTTEPLALSRKITGWPSLGRVTRVKILDELTTAGSSWYGERPDVFLLTTFGTGSAPAATHNSLDWAFDVAGFARSSGTNAGKVLVADEWGGFMTFDYQLAPKHALTHQTNFQWVVAAAMTETLHLAEERVYVAGRGAGPWSVDRVDLASESKWRRVGFDWTQAEPQPHPVSALCTRRDPAAGLLIAALGHEKAMAWGSQIMGQLYRETATNIELLAQADAFDPPGGGSVGVSAVWPERDLVYMATGSDGFRAYVIDPSAPSITLHSDCRAGGFATNVFSTALAARCLRHYTDGSDRKLFVGGTPGVLVGEPTLNVFAIGYPGGVPDRDHPDAPIRVVHETALQCLRWKPVHSLDVRPSGLVAVATSAGLALFHLSWVPALNQMNDFTAWNRIRVPPGAYAPWWTSNWTADIADVSFVDDNTIYAVKTTEGLWRILFELDPTNHTHRCLATAYYPGVSCGMNYTQQLHGWANPDIPTLHHPYGVVADGDTAYVTGWSGKVQRLTRALDAGVRIRSISVTDGQVAIEFASPFENGTYEVEAAIEVNQHAWMPRPDASVQRLTDGVYRATCSLPTAPMQFLRIRVRPGGLADLMTQAAIVEVLQRAMGILDPRPRRNGSGARSGSRAGFVLVNGAASAHTSYGVQLCRTVHYHDSMRRHSFERS